MKRFVKVMTVLMVSLALAGCSSGKPKIRNN
ncbi:YgdI/YgdR family lipoprotein [Erysipelothrix sp. D19-032]